MDAGEDAAVEPLVWSEDTGDRLRRLPLFAGLAPPDLAVLLEGAVVGQWRRDTVLFRQGDPASAFYVVLSGRVALLVTDQGGRETIIEVGKAGGTFGEEAIFDRGTFPFGARVIEDARLVRVAAQPFLVNLTKDFRFVKLMLANLSGHLRFLVRQVGELKLKTTEQRLGSYLLGQVPDGSDSAAVRLPYDKKILASELGMTPETLSRSLAKLRDIGVRSSGGRLWVDDVVRLRDYCRESEISD